MRMFLLTLGLLTIALNPSHGKIFDYPEDSTCGLNITAELLASRPVGRIEIQNYSASDWYIVAVGLLNGNATTNEWLKPAIADLTQPVHYMSSKIHPRLQKAPEPQFHSKRLVVNFEKFTGNQKFNIPVNVEVLFEEVRTEKLQLFAGKPTPLELLLVIDRRSKPYGYFGDVRGKLIANEKLVWLGDECKKWDDQGVLNN